MNMYNSPHRVDVVIMSTRNGVKNRLPFLGERLPSQSAGLIPCGALAAAKRTDTQPALALAAASRVAAVARLASPNAYTHQTG